MAVFNSNGRLFHIRGAETESVRSPYMLVDDGTRRSLLERNAEIFYTRFVSSPDANQASLAPGLMCSRQLQRTTSRDAEL